MTKQTWQAAKLRLFRAMDAIVLAVMSVSLFSFAPNAMASGTLSNYQIRMSDGRPSGGSSVSGNWQVLFNTATAINTSGCLLADTNPCFYVNVLTPVSGGSSVFINGAGMTAALTLTATPAILSTNYTSAPTPALYSTGNSVITLPIKVAGGTVASIPAGTTFTVDLTNNAITNPAKVAASGIADIYTVGINTELFGAGADTYSNPVDSAATRVAINDAVSVSATIATTLSVVRIGEAADSWASALATDTINTSADATACSFGTIVPNHSYLCEFNYAITTNSENGYQYYLYKLATMTDGTNNIVDFNNGSLVNQSSATTWSDPTNDPNNSNTWGHLAYTSDNSGVFSTGGGQTYAGIATKVGAGTAISSAGLFAAKSTAVTGDSVNLAIKLMTGALQPAGSYSVTLTDSISAKY